MCVRDALEIKTFTTREKPEFANLFSQTRVTGIFYIFSSYNKVVWCVRKATPTIIIIDQSGKSCEDILQCF